MKKSYVIVLAVIFITIGCYPPPEFPNEPSISFNDVAFYDNPTGISDSIVLSINFRDGDGDLGLKQTENDVPYNPFFFLVDGNGNLIEKGSDPNLPEDDCTNYAQIDLNDSTAITVLVQQNPDHYNIEVDYFVKRGDTYEFFDFLRFRPDQCGLIFYGRFPLLVDDDEIGEGPIEGVLSYRMESNGFIGYFEPDDSLKLRVLIRDRALNESEEIFTPPFTLNSIRN